MSLVRAAATITKVAAQAGVSKDVKQAVDAVRKTAGELTNRKNQIKRDKNQSPLSFASYMYMQTHLKAVKAVDAADMALEIDLDEEVSKALHKFCAMLEVWDGDLGTTKRAKN